MILTVMPLAIKLTGRYKRWSRLPRRGASWAAPTPVDDLAAREITGRNTLPQEWYLSDRSLLVDNSSILLDQFGDAEQDEAGYRASDPCTTR